jgi:hypothetical protein
MCRAEFVKILELSRDVSFAKGKFIPDRIYYTGGIVRTANYDNDTNVQVGVTHNAIHFCLTREEAEQNWRFPWVPPIMPAAEYWKSTVYRGWVDGVKCIINRITRKVAGVPESYSVHAQQSS